MVRNRNFEKVRWQHIALRMRHRAIEKISAVNSKVHDV